MAKEDWKVIALRIRPEVHWVIKKYCEGEYQVAVRALITRYAKKLLEKNAGNRTIEEDALLAELNQEGIGNDRYKSSD